MRQLGLEFEWTSPSVDETALPGEEPAHLVERLSLNKAKALAADYADHAIIGSDQVASLGGEIITKPGNFDKAMTQLRACSGRSATFYTGLCIFHAPSQQSQLRVVTTEVAFRQLTDLQIRRYLETEQPYDCAGSFKCEGLGISLFEKITSDDPTALIGLPLITLTTLLNEYGLGPL